jgi:triacylglycerol esterase/lipase EstA (alpha/beta hydrolase family)
VGIKKLNLYMDAIPLSHQSSFPFPKNTMSFKPTFILVHGAGHGPECWDKVCTLLKEEGFKTAAVTLPTTLGDSTTSFKDDVKATQDLIQAEISQGHNVIVVVHSMVGWSVKVP